MPQDYSARAIADAELSRAEQDYLSVIHELGGTDRQVSPIDVANALEVRPPSVTGKLKQLDRAGWISYKPGEGARLTRIGVLLARQVIRRQRLLELLLVRTFGFAASEVESEADILRHAISPRLERALSSYLGNPSIDPHGHPIPPEIDEDETGATPAVESPP